MLYQAITEKSQILRARERLFERLTSEGNVNMRNQSIKNKHGKGPRAVYWRPDERFWFFLEHPHDPRRDPQAEHKHVCMYETQFPDLPAELIWEVEISIGRDGTSKMAGVFVSDSTEDTFLVHSGLIWNPFDERATSEYLLNDYPHNRLVEVKRSRVRSGKVREEILVTSLESPTLVKDVADFVHRIVDHKAKRRGL